MRQSDRMKRYSKSQRVLPRQSGGKEQSTQSRGGRQRQPSSPSPRLQEGDTSDAASIQDFADCLYSLILDEHRDAFERAFRWLEAERELREEVRAGVVGAWDKS